MKRNLVLLLSYSRSGGTLFNKCLAVMPNVVMLSEVNKLGGGWGVQKEKSFTTVKSQAENWYGIPIENIDFDQAIFEFIDKVISLGKTPVIRDWCHVCFNPSNHNDFNPPNKLLTFELLKDVPNLKTVCLIRNAIDVFISSKAKDVNIFFSNYRRYVDEVVKTGAYIIRYEDFCENPEKVLSELCTYCGINFDPDFINKYSSFQNVNGDVQRLSMSRNLQDTTIKLTARGLLDFKSIQKLNANADMQYCNSKLGYSTSYYEQSRKSGFVQLLIRKFWRWLS